MANSLDHVQLLLRRLASHEISLDEFQSDFVPYAWTIKQDDDAFDLAGEVELRLAEFTSGHWTVEELRGLLESLVGAGSQNSPRS